MKAILPFNISIRYTRQIRKLTIMDENPRMMISSLKKGSLSTVPGTAFGNEGFFSNTLKMTNKTKQRLQIAANLEKKLTDFI